MSGLLDQAGLTAGSGLSNGAGLYKWGNFNPFDPTDLDPYLLFDTAAGSMIGTLENPTLDLDPSNQETLDVITATRASVATRTLSDGTIALAEQDTVRVDYTQGDELTPTKFQQLEQTDFSLWAHARTSGTANAAISPDGQNNATYVEQDAGQTNAGSIYRFDAAVTGVFTLSVYAKKKEKDFVVLYDSNVGRTYFNLETGTIGTIAAGNTAKIEDAGNGWFRCSTTFTASSGGVKAFYVGDTDNSFVVTDGGGIYLYGPQLEEGTTASDFVANTTGSPKFITGATYGPRVPMILVEPSATNLVTYSEDFSQSSWIKTGIGTGVAPVVTLNAAESPDGTQNATKVVFDSGSGITTSDQSLLEDFFNPTSGTSYTQSIYLKGENGGEKILLRNAGNNAYTTITLTTEWARYEVTETANGSTAYFSFGLRQGLGGVVINSKITVYAYGAQVEAGSVATSLIPTSGGNAAARTRAADDLVISGSDFDFYNQTEGTFYCEFQTKDATAFYYLLNSQSEQARFFYSNGGTNTINSFDGTTALGLTNLQDNTLSRVALSIKASEFKASKDGSSEAVASHNGNLLTVPTELRIGKSPYNEVPLQLNGHIKRLIYWPTHSDNL